MRFGIFDHLDDSGLPLTRHFEERLRLIKAYDRAGFWLPSRRASQYAARLCALARRFPVRCRPANPAISVWADGLYAPALSSTAADRRDLHARSDERGPLPLRGWARDFTGRSRLLRD